LCKHTDIPGPSQKTRLVLQSRIHGVKHLADRLPREGNERASMSALVSRSCGRDEEKPLTIARQESTHDPSPNGHHVLRAELVHCQTMRVLRIPFPPPLAAS